MCAVGAGKRSRRFLVEKAASGGYASAAALDAFAIEPMDAAYLGAWMVDVQAGAAPASKYAQLGTDELMRRQLLVQVLSETRFDSLQRLCAFFVLFHAMGKAVADWWPRASCGLLGYDMSRSQSILRVATTASPVSGMEVRERMLEIRAQTRLAQAVSSVQRAWRASRAWSRGSGSAKSEVSNANGYPVGVSI